MSEQQQTPPQSGPQSGPYQASYQPPPPGPAYKRLTRTSWDAPVSGVCGGIAYYLGIDPTLVRVLAAIAMLVTFPAGPIVYAVLWAVVPKQ